MSVFVCLFIVVDVDACFGFDSYVFLCVVVVFLCAYLVCVCCLFAFCYHCYYVCLLLVLLLRDCWW